MKKHDLADKQSDGTPHWVHIREQDEVTVRGRRGIMAISSTLGEPIAKALSSDSPGKALTELNITEEQSDGIYRMQEAAMVAFLAGWSYREPLPTMATVGDLPVGRYDALVNLTAAGGAAVILDVDTNPTLEPDPKALTGA